MRLFETWDKVISKFAVKQLKISIDRSVIDYSSADTIIGY